MLNDPNQPGVNPLSPDAKKVFEGLIFTVWQWEQKLYDGSTATFERLERADTAIAIGILPDKKIILVEDEQPHRSAVITAAGGRIEPGEDPESAIKREFLEETGYQIGTLIPWYTHHPSSKIDWTVHAYIARDLKRTAEPNPDAGERITTHTYTFDEFLQLGSNPKLTDCEIRIMLLEAQLDPRKKDELSKLLYD